MQEIKAYLLEAEKRANLGLQYSGKPDAFSIAKAMLKEDPCYHVRQNKLHWFEFMLYENVMKKSLKMS